MELHLGLPPELALRLGRIAEKLVDLCRTQIALVALDLLLPVEVDKRERLLQELLN